MNRSSMMKTILPLALALLISALPAGCGGARGMQGGSGSVGDSSSADTGGDVTDASELAVVDSASLKMGIAAEVRQRPTRPIENEDDIPWAPLPGATVVVEDRTNKVLGKVKSDANGRIYLSTKPGTHYLRAQPFPGKMFPHPLPSVRVYVPDGEIAHVVIEYDTGIR